MLSMTILKQSQYPSFTGVGFPKSLTSLTVNDINCRYFDTRICALPHLKTLDLSANKLKKVPDRLWTMKLAKLNLSNNEITELPNTETCPDSDLFETLQYFDISHNKVDRYPQFLRHCKQLNTLKLAGNKISFVPECIKTTANTLRFLDVENCNLKNLPASMKHLALNDFKVSGNPFPTPVNSNNEIYKLRTIKTCKVPSLQSQCVKSIIRHGLKPSDTHIPPHLLNYINSTQNCTTCYKLVLDSCTFVYFYPVNFKSFASTFSRIRTDRRVTMTGFACSQTCFNQIIAGKRVVPAKLFFRELQSTV